MRDFEIAGLPVGTFGDMIGRPDAVLAAAGMRRVTVDATPGYPCRVSLVDAEVGETVLLGTYRHHAVAGPYAASGPIFVREAASRAYLGRNDIPPSLRRRLLSARCYDADGRLLEAAVLEGAHLEVLIGRVAARDTAAYLQVHNAGPGCFLCQINLA